MDYTKLVRRTPPAGLWEYAQNDPDQGMVFHGLVYEKVFVPDLSPDGMIGERRGKKVPMVRCTCSACGETWDADYCGTTGPDGATYGFIAREGGCQGCAAANSGDEMSCPQCGTPVSIKCKSKIRSNIYTGVKAFLCAEYGVMSAELLPGEPGRRPLALIGWDLRRYCDRDGKEIRVILPYDAYVFDEAGCCKLTGHVKSYGPGGYFETFKRAWAQPKSWSESWGECGPIYGLTPEILEESCLYNSKLLEYMAGGLRGAGKYPIPYLRLYQHFPQVENLVVQDATHILDGLMTEQMRGGRWGDNVMGIMDIGEDVNWEERRPAAMLGLDKPTFAKVVKNRWCPELLRLYRACQDCGELLTDADIEGAHQLGEVEQLTEIAGRASVHKAIRYIQDQIEDAEEEYLYDEDIDVYVDPSEFCNISVTMLLDYWDMAAAAGWNLDEASVRWPRHLEAAHDRAMSAVATIKKTENQRKFRKRYKELTKYSFAWGGLLIRPCKTMKELTREGEQLHHCVASYADKICAGRSGIFFIRRASAPGKPWYTLELDDKNMKVLQNRGKCNCARTDEVSEFEKIWVQWLADGCQREPDGLPIVTKAKSKEVKTA